MADIADEANKTADLFLDAALKNRAHSVVSATTQSGIGLCLNCGADVDGDRRWCDRECRDMWEQEQKRRT